MESTPSKQKQEEGRRSVVFELSQEESVSQSASQKPNEKWDSWELRSDKFHKYAPLVSDEHLLRAIL